jgi:MGT family glycosyltransferase
VFATDRRLSPDALPAIVARAEGLRGAEALRFLWKDFILPVAEAMLPEVESAVDAFVPDVLIVDQQAIAGAVSARRRGLRWATSATTSSELANPYTVFPRFGEWIADELRAFQHRAGIPSEDAAKGDLRFSDRLVLAFTTIELVGGGPFPAEYVFVGPAIGTRPVPADFPWSWLDPRRRRVLITLGTVSTSSGARFLNAAAEAAARLEDRLQAIIVAPQGMLNATASNVLVRPRVPQLELLPQLDAVVCHAGHNTVCESLANGLPLVVAPIRDDQPIIAQQVVDAQAGIRLKYGRAGCDEIADALVAISDVDSYREAARRIQMSFRAAGGARVAADRLESLARQPAELATAR